MTDAEDVRSSCKPGWAEITSGFTPGDTVELELDVDPRLAWPDPRIDSVRGAVAVERGPLVLCLESTDLPSGIDVEDIRLEGSGMLVADGDGARISATIVATPTAPASAPPFSGRRDKPVVRDRQDLPLVPYHRWAERGPSRMRVFLPTEGDWS